MEIGMVGLGRMGLNMARRLLLDNHTVVGHDRSASAIEDLKKDGGQGAGSVADLVSTLKSPRLVWLMIPSGKPVDEAVEELAGLLKPGDLVVDGGNSNYKDSKRHGEQLQSAGVAFADAGVSGGIWGLENGYCIMIGGKATTIDRLKPVLDALSPDGFWQHVGPVGSGHFSKMVHNGIEYGMMQSYAEGFELLKASEYDFDLARLSNLWNHGSVVRSWLLELAENSFTDDPDMEKIQGYVQDSGEGRWAVETSIDLAVPTPLLALALYSRFRSRQDDSFRDRVLASLRNQFGGHAVKAATK